MKKINQKNLYKSLFMMLLGVICLAGAIFVFFFWN
jgi:hypothetical protein